MINPLLPAAAVCIVQNGDGQVLAVSRGTNLLDLGLPGGKVEPGESPVAGACRELFEETGIVARPEDCTFLYAQQEGRYMVYTYIVNRYAGALSPATREGTPLWVDAGRLCTEKCTFAEHNKRAFEVLRIERATAAVSAL